MTEPTLWSAFHFYYHEDRRRLLQFCIRPIVSRLLSRNEIQSFFYILYPLGGPHVRLRLHHGPGAEDSIAATVKDCADAFFARFPAKETIPAPILRKNNKAILAGAPLEDDSAVYDNNSVRSAPFTPEEERYGGPQLLHSAHELFCHSSAQSLALIQEKSGETTGRRTAANLRLLARQAWGLADDPDQLIDLLGCRVDQRRYPTIVSKADRVLSDGRRQLIDLMRSEFRNLLEPDPEGTEPSTIFSEASRLLASEVRDMDEKDSRWIKASQLHMTGNRLGLTNAEESYCGRLLARTAIDISNRADPEFWQKIKDHFAARASSSCRSWKELRSLALAQVSSTPENVEQELCASTP